MFGYDIYIYLDYLILKYSAIWFLNVRKNHNNYDVLLALQEYNLVNVEQYFTN